jgi:hypothetical protein
MERCRRLSIFEQFVKNKTAYKGYQKFINGKSGNEVCKENFGMIHGVTLHQI